MLRDNRGKTTTPSCCPPVSSVLCQVLLLLLPSFPTLPFDSGVHTIPLSLLPLGKYQFCDRPSYSHFPSLSAVSFLQYQAITTPYVEEF